MYACSLSLSPYCLRLSFFSSPSPPPPPPPLFFFVSFFFLGGCSSLSFFVFVPPSFTHTHIHTFTHTLTHFVTIAASFLLPRQLGVSKDAVKKVLDAKLVMRSYESRGGTGPKSVTTMIAQFQADLETSKKTLVADVARTEAAHKAVRDIAAAASVAANGLTQTGLREIVGRLHPKGKYVAPK